MLEKYPKIQSQITEEIYKEISEIFGNSLEGYGRPQIYDHNWASLNKKFPKDIIREALIIYILENKCPFPFKIIDIKEVCSLFLKLRAEPYMNFIEEIKYKEVEGFRLKALYKFKFVEEEHSFDEEGCLLINAGHNFNRGSDYFQQENRYSCGTWQLPSPLEAWGNWNSLKAILGPIWRLEKPYLNEDRYTEGIRLGLYNATQFKPPVAKTVYDMFKAKSVLDISCGWGDRLFGFYTSNALSYTGFDPNPAVYEKYKEQCLHYEKILGRDATLTNYDGYFECKGVKFVRIYNKPAEDVDYSTINPIDVVFSSPPYFSTEKYASENKESQSWFRYQDHLDWQNKFLHKVLEKCSSVLKPDGIIAVNIVDGSIKGERQKICAPMINFCEKDLGLNYKGQIGMAMKKRPNTDIHRMVVQKENESNEDFRERLTKVDMLISEIPYIEPIFVFTNKNIKLDMSLLDEVQNDDDLFQ